MAETSGNPLQRVRVTVIFIPSGKGRGGRDVKESNEPSLIDVEFVPGGEGILVPVRALCGVAEGAFLEHLQLAPDTIALFPEEPPSGAETNAYMGKHGWPRLRGDVVVFKSVNDEGDEGDDQDLYIDCTQTDIEQLPTTIANDLKRRKEYRDILWHPLR